MPKLSFFIRHSLPFTTLFFVVLTIVATAIMLIDWYVPTLILGISVAVAMGVYYRVGKYLAVDESSYDWLLIAFVVLWVGINGFLASEHIFTNRDPATYANTAIKLSKDQTINIPQTHLFNQVAGASERSAGFSLNEETDNIDTQGQHALPAAVGVFGSLLGSEYSLRFNAVIGGVALIAIYLAARLYLRPEWALGSAVALGITMPMMYFSRDMYTEPLAILMTWTTLLFFVSAFKHRNIKSLWVVAGAMLGATALSRIDAGLFIAGIFAGVLFVQFATKQTVAIRRGILLSVVASLPLVGLAMYDLWRYSRLYLINHSEEIILQYLAVVVLVGVVLVTALIGPRTERLLSQLRGMLANPKLYAIGGVVLAICILGLWMRPYVASQEYSHQNEYVKQVESANGIDETGVTNYSRYSIEWVGWYLGEVILVLGAIGLIALLASRLIHHRASEVLLVTIIGTAGWYLYSPSITPDQVWASRRFLVVLIPGLIICAMMVLSFVAQKLLPIRYRQVYIAGGFLFAVLPILMSAKPLLQDQRLMLHTEPMQQFCGSLPDNSAVLWLGMGRLEAVAPTRIMCDVPSAGFSNADRDTPDNPVKRDLQQYARSLREQGYTPVIAVFEENLYTLSEAEVNIANLNRITERDYAVLKPTIFGAPRDLRVVDSAIYAARVMDDGSLEAINR